MDESKAKGKARRKVSGASFPTIKSSSADFLRPLQGMSDALMDEGMPIFERLAAGERRLTESFIGFLHNKSYAVTAEVVVPHSGAEGVIAAMGGITGGWSLYCKAGKLKHCYSFFGLNRYYAESERRISPGMHRVRMEFAYDGGGPAEGGDVTLCVDGEKVGGGRVERTEPALLPGETCKIGAESGSPVTDDYGERAFSGEVNWVEIDLGRNAHLAERCLRPSERLRIAG